MIKVTVDQLFLSNMGFAVLLKSNEDGRSLPIMIGAAEAQAIALCLNDVEVPRPLTHDLFKSVLVEVGCDLKRMEVSCLKDGTFYARLIVDHLGVEMDLDSRPSDAIALALRFGAPIFVDESVMNEAGRVFSDDEIQQNDKGNLSSPEEKGEKLSPMEVLKRDMSRAIKEERYEDCARIRDEITRLSSQEQHLS